MNNFTNLLKEAKEVATMAERNTARLKDEHTKSIRDMEQKQRDLAKLERIQSMAGWASETGAYSWILTRNEASTYSKTAWSEIDRYKASTLEFCISLKERTDLKRIKWEVAVTGTRTTLGTTSYRNDSYRDHDYIKDMYMKREYINYNYQWSVDVEKGGHDVVGKFKSEAEARAFAKAWRERLMADHAEEIAYELALCNEIRATLPVATEA